MRENALDELRLLDARDHLQTPAAPRALLDLDPEHALEASRPGTYGRRQREPLQVPYLAMIRGGGQHSLDYLLQASRNDYYELEVAGARHLDFTDDTFVLPILKWFGLAGSIDGWRIVEITNDVALQFFDAYLRGAPEPRFDAFPEVTVRQKRP